MTFFTRHLRSAAILPVLIAALTLRWIFLLAVCITASPLIVLAGIAGIASLYIIAQERRHGDVPPALLRAATQTDQTATHFFQTAQSAGDILAGIRPEWPVNRFRPQRKHNI